MNQHLERVLKGSTDYDFYLAISEYRVGDALAILSQDHFTLSPPWWRFWAKSTLSSNLDPIKKFAFTLLSNGANAILTVPDMDLTTSDKLFPDWMRLCCSLHYSGHFSVELESLLKQTAQTFAELASEIQEKSNGYPGKPINGGIWLNGATVRNWSDALSYLLEIRQMVQERAVVLQEKCRITCAIMSHYPNLVGPDFIDAADALVLLNDTNTSKKYYNAVIADFEPLAQLWASDSDEPITPENLISLRALVLAYNGLERVDATQKFNERRQKIELMIHNAESSIT